MLNKYGRVSVTKREKSSGKNRILRQRKKKLGKNNNIPQKRIAQYDTFFKNKKCASYSCILRLINVPKILKVDLP